MRVIKETVPLTPGTWYVLSLYLWKRTFLSVLSDARQRRNRFGGTRYQSSIYTRTTILRWKTLGSSSSLAMVEELRQWEMFGLKRKVRLSPTTTAEVARLFPSLLLSLAPPPSRLFVSSLSVMSSGEWVGECDRCYTVLSLLSVILLLPVYTRCCCCCQLLCRRIDE